VITATVGTTDGLHRAILIAAGRVGLG